MKTNFDKGHYYLIFLKHSSRCPPRKTCTRSEATLFWSRSSKDKEINLL